MPETVTGHAWLWPDHVIGKRESRELREEHNALVNAYAALLEAKAPAKVEVLAVVRGGLLQDVHTITPNVHVEYELIDWDNCEYGDDEITLSEAAITTYEAAVPGVRKEIEEYNAKHRG